MQCYMCGVQLDITYAAYTQVLCRDGLKNVTHMTGGFSVGFPRAASSSGWEMVPLSIIVVAMAAAHFSSVQAQKQESGAS